MRTSPYLQPDQRPNAVHWPLALVAALGVSAVGLLGSVTLVAVGAVTASIAGGGWLAQPRHDAHTSTPRRGPRLRHHHRRQLSSSAG